LRASGAQYELYRYPGAGHAFTNKTRPEAYNADAAALAFERAFAFMNKNAEQAK
jgi:carboxymethylenebutenolidase